MTQWNESLWGDEGFSAMAVQRPFLEMFGVVMRDTAPPLFYLVGWGWGRLFGWSEVALRSLTLLLVMGASVFAGLIVWRVSRQKLPAVLTFALCLGSPFLFQFAFEWRMYALLAFTISASNYFFISRRWGWYVVFSLAAVYTHHFALFTLLAQALWFMGRDFNWGKPQVWLTQLRPFIIIGLLYLPWLYPMYLQISRVKGGGFWLGKPTLKEAGTLLLKFFTGGVPQKFRAVVAAAGTWLTLGKQWRQMARPWFMMAFIFLLPVLLAFGISYLITPIFYDRYLLSVIIGMAILISVGTPKKLLSLLLILVLGYGYFSWQQFIHPTKRPFRDLAAYVKSQISPTDVILNYNGRSHHLWESKYYGLVAPIYSPGGPLPFYTGTAQMTDSDVIYQLPRDARIGIITSDGVNQLQLPGYELGTVRQFGDLSFSWWMLQ